MKIVYEPCLETGLYYVVITYGYKKKTYFFLPPSLIVHIIKVRIPVTIQIAAKGKEMT